MFEWLKGKKIEQILIFIIMTATPFLVFVLFWSLSILLLVFVVEVLCIVYLAIRKRSRNQFITQRKTEKPEIEIQNNRRDIPTTIPIEHNGSLQLFSQDMELQSLDTLEGFNMIESYGVFMRRNGRDETVMILTRNPNALPEWMCAIMAFKIERFTQSYNIDHLAKLLDHIAGKSFSISYVTDVDHAYIRVIRERPVVKDFAAAALVVITSLLDDFLLVYDAFITEFPGCEIKQLVDVALRNHLFRDLFDYDPQASQDLEFEVKRKDIETELEYEKIEMKTIRTFFPSTKHLRERYATVPSVANDENVYDMMEGDIIDTE